MQSFDIAAKTHHSPSSRPKPLRLFPPQGAWTKHGCEQFIQIIPEWRACRRRILHVLWYQILPSNYNFNILASNQEVKSMSRSYFHFQLPLKCARTSLHHWRSPHQLNHSWKEFVQKVNEQYKHQKFFFISSLEKSSKNDSLSIICKFHSFTLCPELFNTDDWSKDFLSPNLHWRTNICYNCRFEKEPSSEMLPIHQCSLDQWLRNQNQAMKLRMLTCGRAPPYRIVAPSLLAVEMNFFIFSYWIKQEDLRCSELGMTHAVGLCS